MIYSIDIGTASMKGGFFTRSGSCVAFAKAPIRAEKGNIPPIHEISAFAWLDAFKELTRMLARKTAAGGPGAHEHKRFEPVEAIVVSGNGPTIVPVDGSGMPLMNAITWLDRRASAEAAEASAALEYKLDPAYNLPKILWIRHHAPDIYEKARWFVSCPEYLCARLSGNFVSFLPAEGFKKIIWDDQALVRLSLDAEKFPPFLPPASAVGVLTQSARAEFELECLAEPGIPIIGSGPDFLAALVGTAAIEPGRACDRAGTSEGINLCAAEAGLRDSRLLYMPHIIKPYWNISGVISTSGKAVSWIRAALGLSDLSYDEFFAMAETAQAGAGGLLFLPYLSGERAPIWDPAARGAFIGLGLHHGKAEMARAVVESTGFAIRDVVELMEAAGARVDDIRVTGHPASGRVWNQIKADILQKPVRAPEFYQAELIGNTCMALAAMGEFSDMAEASRAIVRTGLVYEPSAEKKAMYDELFGLYRESYQALKGIFPRLAGNQLDSNNA